MAQVYRFTDANGEVRLMAEIDPAPGGGPAAGTYLPAADSAGATLDTTTYPNQVTSVGDMRTLVFPTNTAALALAILGDAFPSYVIAASGADGVYMGDGTFDPYNAGGSIKMTASLLVLAPPGSGGKIQPRGPVDLSTGGTPAAGTDAAPLVAVSPFLTKTSGALSTQQLVSATGAQIGASVSDVETHTPVTFNPGVATTATCKVELSPDGVTYSTLCIVTKPVGTVFDGEIDDVTVRVPASWSIKLTVVNATLGLTTYY